MRTLSSSKAIGSCCSWYIERSARTTSCSRVSGRSTGSGASAAAVSRDASRTAAARAAYPRKNDSASSRVSRYSAPRPRSKARRKSNEPASLRITKLFIPSASWPRSTEALSAVSSSAWAKSRYPAIGAPCRDALNVIPTTSPSSSLYASLSDGRFSHTPPSTTIR